MRLVSTLLLVEQQLRALALCCASFIMLHIDLQLVDLVLLDELYGVLGRLCVDIQRGKRLRPCEGNLS